MKTLRYPSGEEVLEGDHVLYLGEAGTVEFIATERSGEEAAHWYVEKFHGGGVMITNKTFGRIFLSATDVGDHLEFVSRRKQQ